MKKKSTVQFLCLILILNSLIIANDWPIWRGPNNNGISNEKNWNPEKIKDLSLAWKLNVGYGYSAVSVVDGLVFTMGNIDNKDIVYCLDEKTGKEVWRYTYDCEPWKYAGPQTSPVYDEGKIYTVSKNGIVICFNAKDGKIIWKRNIMEDHKIENTKWGISSSANIKGKYLVINANLAGITLNKNTGKDFWISDAGIGSYSTPVFYTMQDVDYVAIFSAEKLFGVELKTGKVCWNFLWKTSWDINGADPIFFDNKIFLSSGYKTGCALLDITDNKPKMIWKNKNIQAQFGSCVLIDGYIYGPKGNVGKKSSGVSCIDAKTGELQWEHVIGFSSLIAVDNKLVLVNEKGLLLIAEVNSKEYKEIAQVQTVETSRRNPVWTAPVLANKRIYVRNHEGDLYSIKVD